MYKNGTKTIEIRKNTMKKNKVKYSNRWDDPKAIKHKNFKHGIVGLGMSPAESFDETFLAAEIVFNYKISKNSVLFAIHHAAIDGKGLKIPDISFWKMDASGNIEKAQVIIEIDNHKARSLAAKKAKDSIKRFEVKEAFVYIIDTGEWRRFTSRGESSTKKSYSNTLEINLKELLPK